MIEVEETGGGYGGWTLQDSWRTKKKQVEFWEPQNETDMGIKRLEQDERNNNNNNDIEDEEIINAQMTAVAYEVKSSDVLCGDLWALLLLEDGGRTVPLLCVDDG